MAEITGGMRRPLALPSVYSLIQRILGAAAVREHLVYEYIRPVAGERILDLGCGPGDILELLPDVAYTGVDLSEAYVEAARRRFEGRGDFIQSDVTEYVPAPGVFDAVIAVGMVHHLDDVAAWALFAAAARALRPQGRLVTLDPAIADGQPRLAHWLIGRDRGQAIRSPESYRRLALKHFEDTKVSVRHDLARIPYTHAIMVATDARSAREDPR